MLGGVSAVSAGTALAGDKALTGSGSAEFQLVCACCRWPRTAESISHIQRLARAVDWDRVVAVTKRHRVQGLVADGLRAAGLEVPHGIGQSSRNLQIHNLAMTAEIARLRDGLAARQVDCLFVKGLALAILAYGTTELKMSLDIDVLVAPRDIEAACEVLTRMGYHREVPDASVPPEGLGAWVQHFKETSWRHPALGTCVDLHGRLATNPRFIAGIGLDSPRQLVEITKGSAVATLGPDHLMVYLCVHGAESAWTRLKWLADLAALVSAMSEEDLRRVEALARSMGAQRCMAQGLLLAEMLLGLPLGPRGARLKQSAINRYMARLAGYAFRGTYEIRPYRFDRLKALPILVSHFLMAPGWRYKRAELASKLSSPRDRAHGRLPARLSYLYPLLGVGRVMRRIFIARRAR